MRGLFARPAGDSDTACRTELVTIAHGYELYHIYTSPHLFCCITNGCYCFTLSVLTIFQHSLIHSSNYDVSIPPPPSYSTLIVECVHSIKNQKFSSTIYNIYRIPLSS